MRRSQSSSPPLHVSVEAVHWQKVPAPPSGRQSQPATQLSAEVQGAAQRRSAPPELRQALLAQSLFWVQGSPAWPGSVEVSTAVSALVSAEVSAEPPDVSAAVVSPVAVSPPLEPVSVSSVRPPRSTPVVEQAVRRSAAIRRWIRQDIKAPWDGFAPEGSGVSRWNLRCRRVECRRTGCVTGEP